MKSFYASRHHAKRGFSLVFILYLLLLSLSIQADDLPTAEPAPAEATTQPVPEVLPTDAPLPTVEPAPVVTTEPAPVTLETATPELEASPEVTPELTPATPEATAEATVIVPTPETIVLPLLYKAAFEGADGPGLSSTEGWSEVAVEGGKALQSSEDAMPVAYTLANLSDGAVEARFLVNQGEGHVLLGGYRAALAADGTVTLARQQIDLSSTTITLTPQTWALLRLEVAGGQIQILVDGVQVLNYTDATPLATALAAGFAASNGGFIRVDDFALYGTPVAGIVPTPDTKTGSVPQTLGAVDAPSNLAATVNGSSITLTWADNSDSETAFEVQTTPSNIVSVGANITTYTLSNVGCGLTVWFRVRAVEGATQGQWSAWTHASTAPCAEEMCMPFAPDPRVSIGTKSQYQAADGLDSVAVAQIRQKTTRPVSMPCYHPMAVMCCSARRSR